MSELTPPGAVRPDPAAPAAGPAVAHGEPLAAAAQQLLDVLMRIQQQLEQPTPPPMFARVANGLVDDMLSRNDHPALVGQITPGNEAPAPWLKDLPTQSVQPAGGEPAPGGLTQEQIQALATITFDQINEIFSQRMAEALAVYQASIDHFTKERDMALQLILERNAARSQQVLGQLSQLTLG